MPQVKCPWCGEKVSYLNLKLDPNKPDKPIEESCPYCYGDIKIVDGTPFKKVVKPYN